MQQTAANDGSLVGELVVSAPPWTKVQQTAANDGSLVGKLVVSAPPPWTQVIRSDPEGGPDRDQCLQLPLGNDEPSAPPWVMWSYIRGFGGRDVELSWRFQQNKFVAPPWLMIFVFSILEK